MVMGLLPLHVENKLASFMLCEGNSIDDELCWGMEIFGSFSVTYVYDIMDKNEVLAI